MRNPHPINKLNSSFLTLFFLSTFLLSLRTFKKVDIKDVRIYGSELFSKEAIVQNSSLSLPKPLIFIEPKFIEEELKENLSLKKVSIIRQVLPFGLKVLIKTRVPIAYGEKVSNGKKISGFIDADGFFIKKTHVENQDLKRLSIYVYGWQENFKKILSEILITQKKDGLELVKVSFSPNGFLTIEEKDLNTILLGFNPNIVKSQLKIISNLKNQLKKNKFAEKIDSIDLSDPKNPKIKVFKP